MNNYDKCKSIVSFVCCKVLFLCVLTVMMLSSYQMAIKPMETLTAATINGAWSIDQAKNIGSLTPGKKADILILEVPNIHFIAYYLGQNVVQHVIKHGKQVVKDKKLIYDSKN